jgi:hypothetical protein
MWPASDRKKNSQREICFSRTSLNILWNETSRADVVRPTSTSYLQQLHTRRLLHAFCNVPLRSSLSVVVNPVATPDVRLDFGGGRRERKKPTLNGAQFASRHRLRRCLLTASHHSCLTACNCGYSDDGRNWQAVDCAS